MKILIITNYFPPEIGAGSHLFYELGEGLVKNGHEITVVTCIPRYNIKNLKKKYQKKIFVREKIAGMMVKRIKIPSPPKKLLVLRGIDRFVTAGILGLAALFQSKHDLTLLYSPPITLGLAAYKLKILKGTPFLVNIQDLVPQNAIDLGILKNKFLIKFLRFIESFVYRKADVIACQSEGNKKYICSRGATCQKVSIIPNWIDTDFIKPAEKDNEFARKYNLGGKFVVSFAGVMGYSQDMKVIIEAAETLKKETKIIFILVGEGRREKEAQKLVQKKNLSNVSFVSMQPREKYPQVLSASDVSLVTLKKEVITPTVPSKIQSIMAAARPIIATLNLEGDAPKLIKKANCGVVLPAGDSLGLAKSILKLYKDRNLAKEMGKNGRKYAEKNFSRKRCVRTYESIFQKMIK